MKYFLASFIKTKIIRAYVLFIRLTTKVVKNRVVLYQPFKFGYDCNQKYIAEEILRQNLPYELIWITRATRIKDGTYPDKITVVAENDRYKALYYILTSKFCITNVFFPFRLYSSKRRGQVFIDTWHGSLGIKRIGLEKEYSSRSDTEKLVKNINSANYFISNSEFETGVYRNSLLFKKKILEIGHPRNDILIDGVLSQVEKDNINQNVRKFSNYNIPENAKLVLYAPTFRNGSNVDCYDMDYTLLLQSLKEKFASDFVLLLRLHPRIKHKFKDYVVEHDGLYDYTEYADIQELMVAADVMITDYSSCIFDFVLTRKAGFIYASDIADYKQDRGFYYPLDTTPFPIIKNNEELREKILSFDYQGYKNKVEEFLEEKGCVEDGNASKKLVELIKNTN